MKIHYKTCRTLMILEPKTQKGLQNDQKSIRFFTINHMAFRHVGKPYKTCRKWRPWRCYYVGISPFGRPSGPAKPPIPGFLFLVRFLFFRLTKKKVSFSFRKQFPFRNGSFQAILVHLGLILGQFRSKMFFRFKMFFESKCFSHSTQNRPGRTRKQTI